ncbi:MAG: HAMP domain-containing protein, partial [Chloroflexi bacterium]|nr:HAMP domain-containing protein [Chloroflexota bacterium]
MGRSLTVAVLLLLAVDGFVLATTAALLNPPLADLAQLGLFLLVSGGLALGAGHLILLLSGRGPLRSVRLRLLLVPLLVIAWALANVGFFAHLMFVSSHDLVLLSLMLLSTLALSAYLVFLLSASVGKTVRDLREAVRRMAGGQLDSRARVTSRDELGELAGSFNAMAARLEESFERQRELERARRDMVAAVSHDLRTPLASIRAMVESINDGVVSDPETVRRYLATLESEVRHLSLLIDDLFELARIDAGLLELQLERVSLEDLISDTLESMSAQARQHGLSLAGQVPEAVPPVAMDARRIQRVLFNLVQNALRHTPADGSVFVRALDAGGEVHVEVADTGEGIPAEELPRVFERFYQVDRARHRGGSGLGLSIARAIVEAHGGHI